MPIDEKSYSEEELKEILKNYTVDDIFGALSDKQIEDMTTFVVENCDSESILSKMGDEVVMEYAESTFGDDDDYRGDRY